MTQPNEGQMVPEVLDGKVDRTLKIVFGPNEEGFQVVQVFRGEELFWEGVNLISVRGMHEQNKRDRVALDRIRALHDDPSFVTSIQRQATAYEGTRQALKDRLDF